MMERFKENPYTGKPMYYKDNPEAVKKRDSQRMLLLQRLHLVHYMRTAKT